MLFYTQPFWVVLGAHFLLPGERMDRVKVMGLAFAISGISLLLWNTDESLRQATFIGDVMCILASLSWAAIVLLVRKSSLSRVVLTALAPFLGDTIRNLDTGIVLIFAFQVIVVVSLGFLLWFWALSVYPASDMAFFGLLAPLFGVFFGWLIFDDELTIRFIIAMGLVCVGILLNNSARKN